VTPLQPATAALTVEQWSSLSEDEAGELVDGSLVEEESPEARGAGARVAGSGVKYALAADKGRLPDASVFLDGRRPPARGPVREPPDIAIEIVSPGLADVRRDRVEKVADYAAFGVRWYWMLDPQLRTFEVLELRAGAYAHVGAGTSGEVREIPGCPGLVLDLDDLWAALDDLGQRRL
jgi:Uma2 family endonuclease